MLIAGEWIVWDGGEWTKDPDTMVETVLREEADNPRPPAPTTGARIADYYPASDYRWVHDDYEDDIVLYRVISDHKIIFDRD